MEENQRQGRVPDVPFLFSNGRATTFVRFTLPLAAITSLILSVIVVFPGRAGEFWGLLVAYIIPPAGKESIIPTAVGAGFEPFLVATYIAGLDMTLAWFLAWNWDDVTRLPRVGPFVEKCMEGGQTWMADSAILGRSAFMGLVLFVFFPLQGSGAFAGVIVGRLIGMPAQRAWVAIMIGALAAAFTWAYAAGFVRDLIALFGFEPVLQGTVVVLGLAAVVALAIRRTIR